VAAAAGDRRVKLASGGAHLTYCSNIHPGETWNEVRANLGRYLPAVRDGVSPGRPFGIGLRLSAQAARELSAPAALTEFRDFLAANDFYVFTLNGFPYGRFHGVRVKEDAYLPDWRDDERLRYTNELADLLAQLLPDDPTLNGSVSTVPGAFKPLVKGDADIERMREHLLRHAAHLVRIRERTGKRLALALEPEPCCHLETVDETAAFFERWLFADAAVKRFSDMAGLAASAAADALRDHLGVCLDLCHAAVEFEDSRDCIRKLADAGIRIHKLQISAGLRLAQLSAPALQALKAYQDPVYLHQVVESGPKGLRRFADLPEAFATLNGPDGDREWRVHFHVPIFLDELGAFSSTQPFIREVLALHAAKPLSQHLEVETYTWDVLPERLRTDAIEQAIARELCWVRRELAA
jgi:sugar phosphate isomerase/epimerase